MDDLYKTRTEAQNEIGEGSFVAENGSVLYANEACARISGYSVEELLVLPSLYDLVVPEQREVLLERLRQRRTGQRVVDHYESAIIHKSGRRVDVEVSVKLLSGDEARRVIVIRDITERKQVERALKESENRFRQLFEQSVDAVLVHDATGRMIDCNAEAYRSLGYTREELLSLSVSDFASNLLTDRERWEREGDTLWRRALAGEPGTGAEGTHFGEHRRKDGTTFPVEVRVGAVDYGGERMILASARDISERHRAEEILRESEERFRSLVQNATDLIAVVDARGVIQYESPSVERVLGYRPEERVGTSAFDYIHPEDLERTKRTLAEGLRTTSANGKVTSGKKVEGRIRHADGSWRYLEAVASNLLEDPGVRGIVINSRDVTERKRAEEALRWQNEYLSALHETSLALMNRLELSELLEAVVARAGAMIDTPHRYVYLLEPGASELEMRVGEGIFEDCTGYRIKPGECVPGQVWQSGQPVVVDDYSSWERKLPRFSGDIRAVVGMPLKSGAEVVGVIGLAYLEEGRAFGSGEVEMLNKFAGLASVALDNARLYARAQQELAERGRTEEALRESEEKYRMLVEAVQEGIGFVDAEENITYCNGAYAAIFDLTPKELIGRSLLVFLDEQERSKALEQTTLRKNNVRSSYEVSIDTQEGDRKILSASGTPIMDAEGSFQGAVHAIIDITERKRSVELLQKQSAAMTTSMDGMAILGPDGTYTYMNNAHARIYGYDGPEELIGESWEIFYSEEQIQRFGEHILPSLQEHGRWRGVAKGRRRDGSEFPQEISLTLLENGGSVCVVRDITERKKAEEALRESEERYRAVVERTADGIYLSDFETKRVFESNAAFQEMLGYTPEELRAMTIYDLITDARESIDHNSRRIKKEKSCLLGERHYRRKDGTVLVVESSATLVPYGDRGASCCIIRDVTERKALEEQLAHQAFHDSLTGLPNRTLFINRLEHALARAERFEDSVAVLFLDLDNFKVINDSLGHEVGDKLLAATARRLRPCLRPGDTIARLGGDEFTILLENISGMDEVTSVAERIADAMRSPVMLDGQDLFVTFSIGIALGDADRNKPGDLLRNADLALYQAKGSGKAHYEVFDPIMNTRALDRLKLGNSLRRSLEADEFTVCYQPHMDLSTGETIGFEALVRWEHPERGLVSPSEFVPVAEENGLILPIGQKVLEEACNQTREWRQRYPDAPPLLMSVNLSSRQFQHPKLAQDVARVLQETGIEGCALCLEITESVVMEDAPHTATTLRELKDLGVQFAIDDFGTGYSSLSYLKRFPVDYLKIDRSFVAELEEESGDVALVSGIIALAHTLKIRVVAEGVESAGQAAQLRELGCDLAQGNYFSSPLPSAAASDLLERASHR